MEGQGTALNPFVGVPLTGVFDIVTNIETGVTMNRDRSSGIYYASEKSLNNPVYPVQTALGIAVNQGLGAVAGFIDSAGGAVTVSTQALAQALSGTQQKQVQAQLGEPLPATLQNNQQVQSILENPSQAVSNPISAISAGISSGKVEQYITLGILFMILSSIVGIFRRE
ncbi:hypothetical protein [Dehalobacter restrictus]|uniref:Uncharacterized protein n=1 Tax=Dehalobacter restrictus TaxID=55583 RepID=A0A857DK48_9FIRM|nr:hypothetical protein [Dehalobacter restrictus]QHA00526.1 hypothetical protein GQ588_07730 [Dehalobacter restrictus]